MKKAILILTALLSLTACSSLDSSQTSEVQNNQVTVSGQLIAKYQQDFSYLEIYRDGNKISVYAHSDGALDEANLTSFDSTSVIDANNIVVRWLNFEKKEVSKGEIPSYVHVKIEHEGNELFDEEFSLIESGLQKADKALQEIPNNQ